MDLNEKVEELDRLSVQDEIEEKKASIAEKRMLVKEMKRKYGRDWRKVLGMLKPDNQDMFNFSPEIRRAALPSGRRR